MGCVATATATSNLCKCFSCVEPQWECDVPVGHRISDDHLKDVAFITLVVGLVLCVDRVSVCVVVCVCEREYVQEQILQLYPVREA
jgi:hypothetical protein